ncbi:MAG: sigma-70 family RNA polymerase sigma factor [Chthoniobacterales bacterium]
MNIPVQEQTGDNSASEADDIALMLRVKDGDLDAFHALVQGYQYRVVGTVTRMLGNEEGSEDIAQQVFLRVWKSARTYKPTAKFNTWLMTITRNLVFNEIRRRSRHPTQSLNLEFDDRPQQYEDPTVSSPAEQMQEKELQAAIDAAIAALPEQQRMAVVLRRYEELSYDEIAAILSTSVSAVKSMLFRARAELREHLQKYL